MSEIHTNTEGRKLIFFVTEDWYFVSHRLPLALAARDAGYHVYVITRTSNYADVIRNSGIELFPLGIARAGVNPFSDLAVLIRLAAIFKKVRPDIVHNVAIKPSILGTIAARLCGIELVINALAGLGHIFTANDLKALFLRKCVVGAIWFFFRAPGVHVIVQNSSDQETLEKIGVAPEKVALIPGSGVDLTQFAPNPEPSGPIVVAMVSRMLWPKGVGEFIEAARLVWQNHRNFRVLLVGGPDCENPLTIDEKTLNGWGQLDFVEWLGPIRGSEIPSILRRSHIFVLPSYYGEGVPKSLLEGAASGKALVATDTPGCRDVVVHEETGLLVPPRDVEALANTIIRLVENPELRQRLGRSARTRVEARFSIEQIVEQTLSLYSSIRAVN